MTGAAAGEELLVVGAGPTEAGGADGASPGAGGSSGATGACSSGVGRLASWGRVSCHPVQMRLGFTMS